MKKFKYVFLILLTIIILLFYRVNVFGGGESKNLTIENMCIYMSTDELIDKIIADELDNIDMYSTKYIGILSFEIDNNYYVEFSNRHDAIEKLNYKIDLANENDNLYDDLNLLYDILTNNIEKYKKNNYNNNVRSTTNNIKTPNGT